MVGAGLAGGRVLERGVRARVRIRPEPDPSQLETGEPERNRSSLIESGQLLGAIRMIDRPSPLQSLLIPVSCP